MQGLEGSGEISEMEIWARTQNLGIHSSLGHDQATALKGSTARCIPVVCHSLEIIDAEISSLVFVPSFNLPYR
jgi:hypothetical protein